MLTGVLLNKHSVHVQIFQPPLPGIEFHLLGVHWFSFEPHSHQFKTCIKRALYILVTHNKRKVSLTLYRINRQCLLNKNQGHLGNPILPSINFLCILLRQTLYFQLCLQVFLSLQYSCSLENLFLGQGQISTMTGFRMSQTSESSQVTKPKFPVEHADGHQRVGLKALHRQVFIG